MSLTSYRAAPPRASAKPSALSRPSKPFGFTPTAGAKPYGFCSCKGRTIIDQVRRSFILYMAVKAERTALGGPFVSALAVCRDEKIYVAFSRPGSDRLSRVLRRSTIGAGAFHGRVRNGNGCSRPAITTRSAKRNDEKLVQFSLRFFGRTFHVRRVNTPWRHLFDEHKQ